MSISFYSISSPTFSWTTPYSTASRWRCRRTQIRKKHILFGQHIQMVNDHCHVHLPPGIISIMSSIKTAAYLSEIRHNFPGPASKGQDRLSDQCLPTFHDKDEKICFHDFKRLARICEILNLGSEYRIISNVHGFTFMMISNMWMRVIRWWESLFERCWSVNVMFWNKAR